MPSNAQILNSMKNSDSDKTNEIVADGKKSEPMITYQLTLYKHFWAKKHNVDPDNIETHFALLKRTAKKNRVEIFRVTSGPRKTASALQVLDQALKNIKAGRSIKNRLSCNKYCPFYNTENCL